MYRLLATVSTIEQIKKSHSANLSEIFCCVSALKLRLQKSINDRKIANLALSEADSC